MNTELERLRESLSRAVENLILPPEQWTNTEKMVRVAAEIHRKFGGAAVAANPASITGALSVFRATQSLPSFQELRYVCLGMCTMLEGDWSVVGSPTHRCEVLRLVDQQTDERRIVRCFQSLLSSYFAFRLYDPRTNETSKAGWRDLRDWLAKKRREISRFTNASLPWLTSLDRNAELLTDNPCRKMGAEMLRGDCSTLEEVKNTLALPGDSWVMEEVVFAQIKAATSLSDGNFRDRLPDLLKLAAGNASLAIGPLLRTRCIARLVSRYARCEDRPEHIALRNAAIKEFGNPWLARRKWEAMVLDEHNQSDELARQMINSWLKRELINDFFSLLTEDEVGDQRRLEYWLRFEPFIDDMWFALGKTAQSRQSKEFLEFKKHAFGRLMLLTDTTSANNAFVMRIGEYLVVEFGVTGNACFVYEWGYIDALTNASVGLPSVSRKELASQTDCHERLLHIDSVEGTWEQKFDGRICPIVGRWPNDRPKPPRPPKKSQSAPTARKSPKAHHAPKSQSPTEADLARFAKTFGYSIDDYRSNNGAVWLRSRETHFQATAQLTEWGFRKSSTGDWYKYF